MKSPFDTSLKKTDIVVSVSDRTVILDAVGYALLIKYGYKRGSTNRWRYNLSVGHLHRVERLPYGYDKFKTTLFYIELTNYPRGHVYFINGNKLDLRLCNLYIPGIGEDKVITSIDDVVYTGYVALSPAKDGYLAKTVSDKSQRYDL
jgi:hypothetical protein